MASLDAAVKGVAVARKRLRKQPGRAENVRLLRVSVRRLQAVIDLFEAFLIPTHHRRLTGIVAPELRLGQVRSWDVVIGKFRAMRLQAPDRERPSWRTLEQWARREEAIGREKRVKTALDATRKPKLAKPLMAFVKELEDEMLATAEPFALSLDRIRRRLQALDQAPEDPQTVHAVRLEFKRLRYGLEAIGAARGPEDLRRVVEEAKEVTTILGDYNDDYSISEFLSREGIGVPGSSRELLARFLARSRLGYQETLSEFRAAWRGEAWPHLKEALRIRPTHVATRRRPRRGRAVTAEALRSRL